MEKIDVFIPVRLGNTRLPGKALQICNNKPILFHLLERLKKAQKIRNIVVCTTENPTDNLLVDLLTTNNYTVFRGSEKDIIKRFSDASKQFQSDFIINVDGDDIYTDPNYVDEMVDMFLQTRADFIDMIGFPFGFRSVGFKATALEHVNKIKNIDNTETGYRDFFYDIPSFNIHKMIFNKNITFSPKIRLSLDYPEDLVLAQTIMERLGNDFDLNQLLRLFNNDTSLLQITAHLESKWKEHYTTNLSKFSKND
jgi:spore coat polysaccharide biosynthesis protein SpsF (cytidylyltransferase family)